jgi:hypothetical protein
MKETRNVFKLSYVLVLKDRRNSVQACEIKVVQTCIGPLLQPSDQTAAGLHYSAKCRVGTSYSWLRNDVNDRIITDILYITSVYPALDDIFVPRSKMTFRLHI